MDGSQKEGVSVKEIEEFAKKHRYELFFCLLFLVTCIFGLIGSFKMGWNVLLGMGGAIIGILLPRQADLILRKVFQFIFRQDKIVRIVLGCVVLIVACIVPFVIFLILGTVGGQAMHQMASEASEQSH